MLIKINEISRAEQEKSNELINYYVMRYQIKHSTINFISVWSKSSITMQFMKD